MRSHLPRRRPSETITFLAGPIGSEKAYHATVGYHDMEMTRAGEVFINGPKVGSDMEAVMRDSAIALSYALQFGADLHDISPSLTRDGYGRPEGPMGALVDAMIGVIKGRTNA